MPLKKDLAVKIYVFRKTNTLLFGSDIISWPGVTLTERVRDILIGDTVPYKSNLIGPPLFIGDGNRSSPLLRQDYCEGNNP